jgi:biotin carboxyl carrier protein
MQNEIKCPTSGKIAKVLAREGQTVNTGENLLVIVSD